MLLLRALRSWHAGGFQCGAIEHVLEFIQSKITKFEDNVCEVEHAAAGSTWFSIKSILCELLQGPSKSSQTSTTGRKVAVATARRTVMRRHERQSGIQGISFDQASLCWRLSFQMSGKRQRHDFSTKKFLKQGLADNEALQASLQEAKLFREPEVDLANICHFGILL